MSWRRVARRFSIDQASRNQGGRLLEVASGQQERALDRAIFRAPLHRPRGPVRTRFGYYVFEVTRIRPARHGTLAEVALTIRDLLESQHKEHALDDFVTDFQQRWTAATLCRSGFITMDFANAKT